VLTGSSEPPATRVLVVDDDVAVGAIAARILEQAGYGVCLAFSAALALAALASGGCDFDLVLSDIRMPGMSGLELAHEIQRGWPYLPVLLMSGYEEPGTLAAHGLGDLPFLRKPFDREALLEFVGGAFKPPPPIGG
jgi:DNA-binding NtrC family response regulator